MEKKDLMNLPWIRVEDWSELTASEESFLGFYYVSEKDVDEFLKKLYVKISRKLGIPYKDFSVIMRQENEFFYEVKEEIFEEKLGYGRANPKLIELQALLRVPDTTNVELPKSQSVEACLQLFESLSDSEKLEFLQRIENFQDVQVN